MNSLLNPLFLGPAAALAIYIFRLIELNTKRDTIAGKIRENLTLTLFMIVGTVMLIGSGVEFWLRGRFHFQWWMWALGVVCGVTSFIIRRAAIAALGKFWSLHVEIRENHEFVRNGPFRFVRHPAYFSMILELLALGLVLSAPIMIVIVIPFLFVPVLAMRIRIEEAALIERFGEAYRDYRKTTPALFPFTKFSH